MEKGIREAYIEQCTKAGKHAYCESLRAIPRITFGLKGKIAELTIYPIKALGGLPVQSVRVMEHGLIDTDSSLRDRAMMIGIRNDKATSPTDPEFVRFSQREEYHLAQVRAAYSMGALRYMAPDMPPLVVTLTDFIPRRGDSVRVQPVPDAPIMRASLESGTVTKWIKTYLQKFGHDPNKIEVLLRHENESHRNVETRHNCGVRGQTIFSDGGQELLASRQSHEWLQRQAEKRGCNRIFPMNVFRPNIVVDGWPPHLEDILHHAIIQGGVDMYRREVMMLFGDLSVRCKVTMIDEETARLHPDGEPIATATKERALRVDGSSNKPTFAVNTMFPPAMWEREIVIGDTIVGGLEKKAA